MKIDTVSKGSEFRIVAISKAEENTMILDREDPYSPAARPSSDETEDRRIAILNRLLESVRQEGNTKNLYYSTNALWDRVEAINEYRGQYPRTDGTS